ncbi:putative aryl-alcohol dehydrogenase [Naematelia encephala]|uniref:Putative aryl-alcohol dehydrogenase n=1 Tax=Naematelia encephala TaxID=71784 RepID=A0A1Y2BLC5_9TREE|nr:putative aryl-alcohol dehydrogenase [Naematelia encephala]
MAPRILEKSSSEYKPVGPNERVSPLELFSLPPKPRSELEVYRILGPRAGVRVSPLCLGAMSIGDQWTGYMGTGLSGEKAFEFLDTFYEAGGNFIDTSNNYQDEQSEMIIGEWMEKRGIRDQIVLATKYTTCPVDRATGRFKGLSVNYGGNHGKSLKISVQESLKKLKTDYIDLLYVHWWDYGTSVQEVMENLNVLVKSGKVLYLGISDTPAWIVAQANQWANDHGLTPFSVYQGRWSLGDRAIERDIIPMCRSLGLSLAPYGVLGQGKFKTPQELEKRSLRGGAKPTEEQIKLSKALQEVAEEIGNGATLTGVALAWARQNMTYCFPILGGTNIDHLKANIAALDIELSPEQLAKLSAAGPVDLGFPYDHFGTDPHYNPGGQPNSFIMNTVANFKFVKGV